MKHPQEAFWNQQPIGYSQYQKPLGGIEFSSDLDRSDMARLSGGLIT